MGPRLIFADKLFMVYQLTGISLAVICKKERTRRRYLPPTVIVLSQEYLLVEMDRESALGKSTYVTVYGKTRHMGFFVKVKFDASMISSAIELTRVQVLDRSCASLWRYSALFAIAPHPQ